MTIWKDKESGAHIEELCKLSLKKQFEVRRLEFICKEHDHTFSEADLEHSRDFSKSFRCFYLYYDGSRLAGFLRLFAPTRDEAEITGFVDPVLRGNGIFGRLLTYAGLELDKYKIDNAYFVIEPESKDAADAAEHLKLENDRSELLMLLDDGKYEKWQESFSSATVLKISNDRTVTVKPDGDEKERLLKLVSEYDVEKKLISVTVKDNTPGSDEEEIGKIFAEQDGSLKAGTVFIYGFEVKERYRSLGIGKLIMNELVKEVGLRFPDSALKLQVSTLSEAACHIYEEMGFRAQFRLDYYIAETKEFNS